jgi:hypothetical protein
MSALLQQGDLFADIGLLPPISDLWSIYGSQNEPFPSLLYPTWQTFIWESIHQNGNGCDYLSEEVIRQSDTKEGKLQFGTRKYHTIFLIKVERMEPGTAEKLYDFVEGGGRIFCIDGIPAKSVGLLEHDARDIEVQNWVSRMKAYPDRFILLPKPEKDFGQWYKEIQQKYTISPYVNIDTPHPFVTQVRYQAENVEWILFINSHLEESHTLQLSFSKEMTAGRHAWIWDAETGERFRVETGAEKITLDLGPADSRLLVFDKEKKGAVWSPAPTGAGDQTNKRLTLQWSVEFHHIDGSVKTTTMDTLQDLKDTPDFVNFCGTAVYRASLPVGEKGKIQWLNLGKVAGVCELTVNGRSAGVQWYGRRIFPVAHLLQKGENTLEVKVTTVMGNYMKSLKDNAVAQYWTNENRKNQPLQSMGLIGPVTIY